MPNDENGFPPEFVKFFTCYMRLEYALKRCGFTHGAAEEIKASTRKFFGSLETKFFESAKIECPTFVASPPKKQNGIDKNRDIKWKAISPLTTNEELECALRRLRNNLMHGDKIPYYPDADEGRNRTLLREGTKLIKLAVTASKCSVVKEILNCD